jgi:hypothetical protein
MQRMKYAMLRPVVTVLCVIACGVAFTGYAQVSAPAPVSQNAAEYRNDKFQFTLSYPADMKVTTTDEAGGGQTIAFINESTEMQFEILAIPYSQVDISTGEFTPHDAYGTNDQGIWLTDVNVAPSGGVQQFWFVKLGVMYEVLGMEGDEAWLVDILKTWQFE